MNRREAMAAMIGSSGALGFAATSRLLAADEAMKTGMGLVIYCLGHQQRARKRKGPKADLFEPLTFLEECHRLGAGGVQVPLGARDEAYAKRLREQAEQWGMYVEGIAGPPYERRDLERFDAQMKTAALAGARAVRTVIIPGRRYERFESLKELREYETRGRRALELAAPVAEKHRVALAVENHKDQRSAERAELLKAVGSEYVGACLDLGNNMALLEDPLDVAKTLLPLTFSVHLKDQAVRPYEEGFLLADVPLGQGCIDLKQIVGMVRGGRPDVRFSLELITRDPLKVPCLSEKYWATLPNLPARDLVRMLRLAREHQAEELPVVSALPPEQQVDRERANVAASLVYARRELGI